MTVAMESQQAVDAAKSSHPLDFAANWTKVEMKSAYDAALKKVGEKGVANILQSVRRKMEQKTRGGLSQLNKTFHFFDKDGS